MGAAGWGAFKNTLGIHSPSTVFADLGRSIPDGVTLGIEATAPKAQAAVDGMIAVPPSAPDAGGGAAKPAAAKPSLTVTIGAITVNAQSTDQAKNIARDLRTELAQELELLLVQLGGAVPGGAPA
jgi:hypothetical protein